MTESNAPKWFAIAAIAAIIWALIGVGAYIADVTSSPESIAQMPEAQRVLYEARPSWVVGLYAVAVFAAFAGAVLLFLRRKVATPLLGASLAAVIVQMGYVLFGMNAVTTLGWSAAVFPAVIVVIGAAMMWLALAAAGKGWLR